MTMLWNFWHTCRAKSLTQLAQAGVPRCTGRWWIGWIVCQSAEFWAAVCSTFLSITVTVTLPHLWMNIDQHWRLRQPLFTMAQLIKICQVFASCQGDCHIWTQYCIWWVRTLVHRQAMFIQLIMLYVMWRDTSYMCLITGRCKRLLSTGTRHSAERSELRCPPLLRPHKSAPLPQQVHGQAAGPAFIAILHSGQSNVARTSRILQASASQ